MVRSVVLRLIAVVSAVVLSACTVQQTEIPNITGPSEFALSIEVTATPDRVRQDGASQSAIAVRARDSNSQAVSGLSVRFDMSVAGTTQDFGTLSARNVVTGSDGTATVVYTAPAAPPVGAGGTGTTMAIVATPLGTNAQTSQSRSVSLSLFPPGVILPPGGTPTAAFSVSPSPVSVGTTARFDATASQPGLNALSIAAYRWSFGDGAEAEGREVAHVFSSAGVFSVTLTVTNERGLSAALTTPVTVVATAVPTAVITFSPLAPTPRQMVEFNGLRSAAAPGRTIVQYLWNWGDGESATGATQNHDYPNAGTYTVVLTVVDDIGQRGTTSLPVPVAVPTAPR